MSTTYVVELTPAGRGAVAVVLAAGPNAVRAVGQCFAPAGNLAITTAPVGRILFGRWGVEGEELVACRRGEDRVEIHCHGGAAAVRAVVDRLVDHGCHELSWREWIRHPLASANDLIEREAQIALADAVTLRAASVLLDQLNGALSAAIWEAISAITAANWARAAALIDELLARRDVGLHLTTPWRVVLAGAPNVGKSSLINALAGYERAIVSPVPGTTRDVVAVTTAIDGWPVVLEDTAGLRAADDALESAGVALAQSAMAIADLVIVVRDATLSSLPTGDMMPLPQRTLHVRNKIDLLNASGGIESGRSRRTMLDVSALTGAGIGELIQAIGAALVPHPPAVGAAVPFTSAQCDALTAARDAIAHSKWSAAIQALQSLLAVREDSAYRVQG